GEEHGRIHLAEADERFALAGAITGAGGLTTTGDGTLVLTADNTYEGSTTISNAGGLQLGDGGTTGAVAGDIEVQTLLTFKHGGDHTHAGNINGDGAVRHEGTGTLSLTGTNLFAGGLDIQSGRVRAHSLSLGQGDITIAA